MKKLKEYWEKKSSTNHVDRSNERNTRDAIDLMRAKTACKREMGISPLSTNLSTLYVKPDKYQDELLKKIEKLEKKNQELEKANEKRGLFGFRK